VSRKKNSANSSSTPPNWLVIFGLADPVGEDWGQVRGSQITAIRRFALLRLFIIILAGCAVFLSLETQESWQLRLWFAGILLSGGLVAIPQLRQREFPRLVATRKELHAENIGLTVQALCWAALPLLISHISNLYDVLVIWAVITALMGSVTFALATVPLGAATFLSITGGGLFLMTYRLGIPLIAVLTLIYTLTLVAACLVSGRSWLFQKYASIALKEKEEVVSLLLREYEDSGGDWMWQTDTQRCLTHVSPRFALALGLEVADLEAKPMIEIVAGERWKDNRLPRELHDLAEKLKNREGFSDMIVPVRANGREQWWKLSATPRLDENNSFSGFRGVCSDITEQLQNQQKISHLARFDTLTGLPNRLQLNEALGNAMSEAERWKTRAGFLMIDLDRFKAVNDTLGHPVGDRLLVQVAERLRAIMSSNELCGRIGGDEFAVVIKEVKESGQLETIATAIITSLSRPYEIDNQTLYIGASVGCAVSPRDGRTPETLTRSADLALYHSKDQGGGSFNNYEAQLHVHAEERRVLEIALRKALEKNEFQLHYQPVVSALTGAIESFEALLRWHNPELGNVSPAKFIPLAEEARLIRPIGEWVLRTACMEAAKWPSHIRVAVNVSAEQLHDHSFVSTLVSAMSQSGLPPYRLELEVTESLFMREGTNAIKVLDQVLALGVRLALDDFGTGYSSLGYLSKTKFSNIKVDRSFVQGAARNAPESLAIIRAVVALADSLGMTTTAEGVETEDECMMVTSLGCKKIQGYLFGRPMPAKDATALAHEAGLMRNQAAA
jgi:diguanylate cyclase (GGDEF)-like protein/PAS domain S-box-containing protein